MCVCVCQGILLISVRMVTSCLFSLGTAVLLRAEAGDEGAKAKWMHVLLPLGTTSGLHLPSLYG